MAIPPFDSDWITDRLKAGRNPLTADEVRTLAEDGITHVLDLREKHEWSPPRVGRQALEEIAARGIVRRHLPVADGTAPTLDEIDSAVEFIDDALAAPQSRVYVHCRAGLERTASVLVAWYAHTHQVDYDDALDAVRRGRPGLYPLPDQEDVTREWIRTRVADAAPGGDRTAD